MSKVAVVIVMSLKKKCVRASEWHRTSDRMSGSRGSNEGCEVCRHAYRETWEIRLPSVPEASVWAFSEQDADADFLVFLFFFLFFLGSSYVNERLIVAASDS